MTGLVPAQQAAELVLQPALGLKFTPYGMYVPITEQGMGKFALGGTPLQLSVFRLSGNCFSVLVDRLDNCAVN